MEALSAVVIGVRPMDLSRAEQQVEAFIELLDAQRKVWRDQMVPALLQEYKDFARLVRLEVDTMRSIAAAFDADLLRISRIGAVRLGDGRTRRTSTPPSDYWP